MQTLSNSNPPPHNGQATENNQINLILFLTRRICCFARLSMGASPAHKLFWQGQIDSYHKALKAAMVNPIFKAGEQ